MRLLQFIDHARQGLDDLFESRTFAAQFLGAFRFVPDGRVFEFSADFDQTFMLGIEVKDTPSARHCALEGL
jgi:hypothetical protein